jgi:hypothetical protein
MPQILTGWFQGLRPWRVQGRAPALLSFPGSPGPETDMRSSPPAHPRPVSPKRTPAAINPTGLHAPLRKELDDRLAAAQVKPEWRAMLADLDRLQEVEIEQDAKRFILRTPVPVWPGRCFRQSASRRRRRSATPSPPLLPDQPAAAAPCSAKAPPRSHNPLIGLLFPESTVKFGSCKNAKVFSP